MSSKSLPVVLGLVGVLVAACSSSPVSLDDGGGTMDDGGGTMDDGGGTMDDGGGTMDGAATDTGPQDTGIVVDSGDGFGAARTACINEINKLRATEGKQPYALWTSPSIDQCVDEQATNDEQYMSPHQAWLQNKYPLCNGNGQDECLGYGVTPQAVVACLDAMWNEKYQSNCSGCPACANQYSPNCPNCDFYGQMGKECGHYVNMSANWLHKAACGFSTYKNNGKWAVQNFAQ